MKRHTKSKLLGGSKRTRKVFGVNPLVKLLGYVLIAAVVVIGLYLLLSVKEQEQAIKTAETEKEAVQETKAVIEEEPDEEVKEEKIIISDEFDYDNPYGDISNDEGFSDNCKRFINDLKSDMDSLYEHKIEAEENYEDMMDEIKRAEEK